MLLSMNLDYLLNAKLAGHIVFKQPWLHFKRIASEYILYIIKSGEMYLKEDNQEYVLRKGDLMFLTPNVLHIGFKAACCDYYYFHFTHPDLSFITSKTLETITQETINKRKLSITGDFLSESTQIDSICYFPKLYNLKSDESNFMHLISEIIEDTDKRYENYKRLVSYRLQDLIIRISIDFFNVQIENQTNQFSKSYIKIRSIINYLNKEYHKKISSKDIEELFESNYNYLNRIFCKMTGFTITNYLNNIRINKAKELIETSPIKYSEIGYLVGINDPYYFSKIFKKYTGMTPTQYSLKNNIFDETLIRKKMFRGI